MDCLPRISSTTDFATRFRTTRRSSRFLTNALGMRNTEVPNSGMETSQSQRSPHTSCSRQPVLTLNKHILARCAGSVWNSIRSSSHESGYGFRASVVWEHLNQRRRLQPSQSIFVAPKSHRQIQNAPNHTQTKIDGSVLHVLFPFPLDEWGQGPQGVLDVTADRR